MPNDLVQASFEGVDYAVPITNFTVEQLIDVTAVAWDLRRGPLGVPQIATIGGAEVGVEIHKKLDKKDGDVMMLFRVANPKEPRGKHKRAQVCSLILKHVADKLELPKSWESVDDNIKRNAIQYRSRDIGSIIMTTLKDRFIEGTDANELMTVRNKLIDDIRPSDGVTVVETETFDKTPKGKKRQSDEANESEVKDVKKAKGQQEKATGNVHQEITDVGTTDYGSEIKVGQVVPVAGDGPTEGAKSAKVETAATECAQGSAGCGSSGSSLMRSSSSFGTDLDDAMKLLQAVDSPDSWPWDELQDSAPRWDRPI